MSRRSTSYPAIKSVLVWALGACLAARAGAQTTYYVNGSCGDDAWTGTSPTCGAPDGPRRTIQAGIDAAANGDTVLVAAWMYNEVITFEGKAITLRAVDPPEITTINGAGLDDAW